MKLIMIKQVDLCYECNIEKQLLEAAFETISNEVQVMEALLDSTGAIVDFEYLARSKPLMVAMKISGADRCGPFIHGKKPPGFSIAL